MKKTELIKLLLAIGISQVNAEKIAANTNDDSTASIEQTEVDSMISAFKTAQIELAKNNPDIVKPIQDAEKAKQLDIIERKLKQTFGLNPEDVKDKKVEEIIVIAKTKATASGNQTTEQLQAENMRLEGELKKVREEEIPAIKAEVDNHKAEFNYDQNLTKLVSSFELRNPLNAVLPSVKTFLKENFDVKTNDKGEFVVYQKGTDLRAKTADGNAFVELKDLLASQMAKDGFLKQSNGGDGSGSGAGSGTSADGKKIIVAAGNEEDKTKKNTMHLSAAEQHLADIKKLAEANA